MTVLSFQVNYPGQAGVFPSEIAIQTNNTLAQVLATGFLDHMFAENVPLENGMMALVSTKPTPNSATVNTSWLNVVFASGHWSLTPTAVAPGSVTTPTIANHIASFTDTVGTLADDVATAINGGNIQAGLSGTAGYLASFPSAASKGSLRLTAVANTGDTLVTLSNVAHGQATVYSIPDAGNALGRVLVGASATPFTSGNLLSASGTGGLIVDSGVAATGLQKTVTITLTATQVAAMYATPILVLAAPSATSMHVVSSVIFELEYGSVVFSDGGNIWIQYSSVGSDSGESGGNSSAANNLNSSYITGSSNLVSSVTGPLIDSSAFDPIGQPLYISNQDAAFTGGTGSSLRVHVLYTTISGTF